MQEDTMKKPVSTGVIVGVVAVVVLLVAFIGYKVLAPSNPPAPTAAEAAAMNQKSPTQGESYNQQINNRPKEGRGSSSYSQQYGQQMQQGMRR